MEKEDPKYVKIIKTCPGNLVITIVNPMTRLSQRLEFLSDKKFQIISLEWAAYVYADASSGCYRMYKDGYFTFDDPELVKKTAEANGVLMGDVDFEPKSPEYLDDILKVLKKFDKVAIDGYLTQQKGVDDVIQVASTHVSELTKSTIDYLEKKLQISLVVDGGSIAG